MIWDAELARCAMAWNGVLQDFSLPVLLHGRMLAWADDGHMPQFCSTTQASCPRLPSHSCSMRRAAGDGLRTTTGSPVEEWTLSRQWIPAVSMKLSCDMSRTRVVPRDERSSISPCRFDRMQVEFALEDEFPRWLDPRTEGGGT